MSEAKMIRHIPSDKRLPYWDKWEFECIDCGKHYFRSAYTRRTSPYCIECNAIHVKERAKENKEKRQKLYDKKLRNKVIDEYTEVLRPIVSSLRSELQNNPHAFIDLDCIARQMKGENQ